MKAIHTNDGETKVVAIQAAVSASTHGADGSSRSVVSARPASPRRRARCEPSR